MSAIGTKRTSPSALHMSAFDPKRTWIAAKRPVPTLTLAPFPYTSLSRYDALSSALGGGNETTRV